jgi:hypothetical protein
MAGCRTRDSARFSTGDFGRPDRNLVDNAEEGDAVTTVRDDLCCLVMCVGCFVAACGGAGGAADAGVLMECQIRPVAAPSSCPQPMPHYSDVQPIFQQHCLQCHSGLTDQWPLTDYAHVASWYDIIPTQLLKCQMPPLDAGVPMANSERTAILTWLHCGFPE